jgi:hypothetical protein
LSRRRARAERRLSPESPAVPATAADAVRHVILGDRRAAAALLAGIGLSVLLAFSGSFDNAFVRWDDDVYIYQNEHIRDPDLADLAWMFTSRTLHWHPLAHLAHAADWAMFGGWAGGHHATSVLIHGLNAVLVAAVGVALVIAARGPGGVPHPGRLLACCGAAAALWAIHPLRVESVAWASQKKDLLCGLLSLACILSWLVYGLSREGSRRRAWMAAQGFGLLAFAAKPMAIHLPLTLLVLDAWPLRRLTLREAPRRVAEKLPLVAAAALTVAVTFTPVESTGPPTWHYPSEYVAGDALRVPLRGMAFYVEKTWWPSELSPMYPLPEVSRRSMGEPAYALSLAALIAAVGAAALLAWRGHPAFAVALACYALVLLPVSGLLEITAQAGADRFSYLAVVPFFLLGAGAAYAFVAPGDGERSRRAAALAVVAWAVLVLLTRAQVEVWRDSETYWATVIDRHPRRLPIAYVMLSNELRTTAAADPGRIERAKVLLDEAVAAFPADPTPLLARAALHHAEQRWDDAEALGLRAERLAPDHPGVKALLAKVKVDRLR